MRIDLTDDFRSKITALARVPILLLVMHFPSGDVYLSDRDITIGPDGQDQYWDDSLTWLDAGTWPGDGGYWRDAGDGAVTYEGLVMDWGELSTVGNEASQSGTMTATIALWDGGASPFSDRFETENPINLVVDLYQTFGDLASGDHALINTFCVQDPIETDERSMLLKFSLVTVNMLYFGKVGRLLTTEVIAAAAGDDLNQPIDLAVGDAGRVRCLCVDSTTAAGVQIDYIVCAYQTGWTVTISNIELDGSTPSPLPTQINDATNGVVILRFASNPQADPVGELTCEVEVSLENRPDAVIEYLLTEKAGVPASVLGSVNREYLWDDSLTWLDAGIWPDDGGYWVEFPIGTVPAGAVFETAAAWFDANDYTIDGVIPGDQTVKDAIADITWQTRSRLLWQNGKCQLVILRKDDDWIPLKALTNDNIRMKSMRTWRSNVADIVNTINLFYQINRVGGNTGPAGYEASVVKEDWASVAVHGQRARDDLFTFHLVRDQLMANDVADFYIWLLGDASKYYEFQCYLDQFDAEKEDYIQVRGESVALREITRTFGNGRTNQINTLKMLGQAIRPYGYNEAFVTSWQTTAASESVTLPAPGPGNNFTVDWGDGTTGTVTTANPSHTYTDAGTYNISIEGTCPKWQQNDAGDKTKLKAIKSWGEIAWTDLSGAFYGCSNLDSITAPDAPLLAGVSDLSDMFRDCAALTSLATTAKWDTSGITDMAGMFRGCAGLTSPPAVSRWDTSAVTDMAGMFQDCSGFSSAPDVSGWDVSAATNMSDIFRGCSLMIDAPDVSSWDVSVATNLSGIFRGCEAMTGAPDVSGWDTSAATNLSYLFSDCEAMTGTPDVSDFDTSLVTDLSYFFSNCKGITTVPDVSGWDVSAATNLAAVFKNCYYITSAPDVSLWDVSAATNLSYIFRGITKTIAPPNVGSWNTANVADMSHLFEWSSRFTSTPNVTNWTTSNVTDMSYMFSHCSYWTTAPDVGNWNTSNVTNMRNMFESCGNMGPPNITNWDTSSVTDMSYMFEATYGMSAEPDISAFDVTSLTNADRMNLYGRLANPEYDQLLVSWSAQTVQPGVKFHAGYASYTKAAERAILTGSPNNWIINDGGPN